MYHLLLVMRHTVFELYTKLKQDDVRFIHLQEQKKKRKIINFYILAMHFLLQLRMVYFSSSSFFSKTCDLVFAGFWLMYFYQINRHIS